MPGRLLFFLCLLMALQAEAVPDTLRLSEFREHSMLFHKALTTNTSLREKQKVPKDPSAEQLTNWQPLNPQTVTHADSITWLHFWIDNDTDTAQTIYANVHAANQIVVFYVKQNAQRRVFKSGYMTPSSQWAMKEDDRYIPLLIDRRSAIEVLAQISNHAGVFPFWTGSQSTKPSLRLQVEKEAFYVKKTLGNIAGICPNSSIEAGYRGLWHSLCCLWACCISSTGSVFMHIIGDTLFADFCFPCLKPGPTPHLAKASANGHCSKST